MCCSVLRRSSLSWVYLNVPYIYTTQLLYFFFAVSHWSTLFRWFPVTSNNHEWNNRNQLKELKYVQLRCFFKFWVELPEFAFDWKNLFDLYHFYCYRNLGNSRKYPNTGKFWLQCHIFSIFSYEEHSLLKVSRAKLIADYIIGNHQPLKYYSCIMFFRNTLLKITIFYYLLLSTRQKECLKKVSKLPEIFLKLFQRTSEFIISCFLIS